MYDSLAAVWNALSIVIGQDTGRKCSLSESVLEDGCGYIVKDKDQQRGTKKHTRYRKCVRELRKTEQKKGLLCLPMYAGVHVPNAWDRESGWYASVFMHGAAQTTARGRHAVRAYRSIDIAWEAVAMMMVARVYVITTSRLTIQG
jgi:hypothetical protein